MSHWAILPILLPLLAGSALLLVPRAVLHAQRVISLTATGVLLAIAVTLFVQAADQPVTAYAVGSWKPPFGITLVLDRLAAVMVLLTAAVAFLCQLYAVAGEDAEGRYFHALFQFQLVGLNGAFLTGDLFNLFVFFEILLIASYALLLHGYGVQRSRAAIHVVVLNLVGSAVFLVGVGALYGVAGTLNLADLARVVPTLDADALALARTGALLLLVVFALKAAVLPLTFWLPQSYGVAAASVAALFSVMTKVGVYAIIRLHTLVFEGADGGVVGAGGELLLPASLVTFAIGVGAMLAARTLRDLVSWLLVSSVGMLLAAVGLLSEAGLTAAIYYMVHSTFATAALFLIADLIRRQRAGADDRLDATEPVRQQALLGTLFFAAAVAASGLPPLSGFVGKILILQAAEANDAPVLIWSVLLGGSALIVLGLARAGSALFWKTGPGVSAASSAPHLRVFAASGLLAAGALLVVFGAPATDYARATAVQLAAPAVYRKAVLGASVSVESSGVVPTRVVREVSPPVVEEMLP